MTALIFWATISIFFSFLCSILEAVLLSITPTFINVKKQEGKESRLMDILIAKEWKSLFKIPDVKIY